MHLANEYAGRSVGLLLICSALGLVYHPALSQPKTPWPITHFKVHPGEPTFTGFGDELATAIGEKDAIAEAFASPIEDFLHQVAVEYEGMGFRPPVLEPVVELEDGTPAYRVFVYDYPDTGAPASYTTQCAGKVARTTIRIDRSRTVENGQLVSLGLENIAHELFHSVQAAYPLFTRNCSMGDWIWEGTAEAMGIDVLTKLMPAFEPDRSQPQKRWGGRRLYRDLWVMDDPTDRLEKYDAYWTASLWRYLAEYGPAQKKSAKPTPQVGTLDYSYLARFFLMDGGSLNSERSELDWLDTAVQAEFGQNLARIYSHFASVMAAYAPTRVKLTKSQPEEAGDTWRKVLFEDCPKIDLSPQWRTGTVPTTSLAKGGARCFEVLADEGTDGLELTIQTEALVRDDLKQVRIAKMGGKLGALPEVAGLSSEVSSSESGVGMWRFPITRGVREIFIVTNLAERAGATKPLDLAFDLAIPLSYSSIGTTQGNAPVSTDVAERARQGFGKPTSSSSRSVTVGRDRPDKSRPCSKQNRDLNLCGPQLKIAMMKTPDIAGDGGTITGTGGLIGRAAGMGEGSGAGDADIQKSQAGAYMDALYGEKGGMITIGVPLVDYGFTGSFTNADIQVSLGGTKMGVDKRQLEGSRVVLFVPNGKLTIHEYSPKVLRASFKAALYDTESFTVKKGRASIAFADSIEGRITVPAPWRADRDFSPDFGGLLSDTGGDVVEILGKMPPGMRDQFLSGPGGAQLCELGLSPEQLQSLGLELLCPESTGAVVDQAPKCSCSCEARDAELTVPQCLEQCQADWVSCPAPDAGPTDAELKEFIDLMDKHGIPKSVQESYIKSFELSPVNIRRQMIEQLKGA